MIASLTQLKRAAAFSARRQLSRRTVAQSRHGSERRRTPRAEGDGCSRLSRDPGGRDGAEGSPDGVGVGRHRCWRRPCCRLPPGPTSAGRMREESRLCHSDRYRRRSWCVLRSLRGRLADLRASARSGDGTRPRRGERGRAVLGERSRRIAGREHDPPSIAPPRLMWC
jgi:hypothetical protein